MAEILGGQSGCTHDGYYLEKSKAERLEEIIEMASPKIIGHQQGQSGNDTKIPAPFRIFPKYIHTFLQDSVIQNKITASDNHE